MLWFVKVASHHLTLHQFDKMSRTMNLTLRNVSWKSQRFCSRRNPKVQPTALPQAQPVSSYHPPPMLLVARRLLETRLAAAARAGPGGNSVAGMRIYRGVRRIVRGDSALAFPPPFPPTTARKSNVARRSHHIFQKQLSMALKSTF